MSTESKLKLKVIIGSTRPGRVGPSVANWVNSGARDHGGFEVELVDLAEIGLPLLDEPNHPAMQKYENESTKKWSAVIGDADAVILVTPEYDFFAPATLVNALQVIAVEWKYKPVGLVSYGGISGGLRSAQELRTLISNKGAMPLPNVVPIPMVFPLLEDGTVKANDPMKDGLQGLFDELVKWGQALKPLHSA
ncbi:NADPH-dependent FMN reductase [Pseudooceanicola sp. 200-1SW]|uniref:NADPH-dependent FMN reductase n=1 Tax=Pseudooceanicola sp. 200-1SW TaxID=3425949 RepID=UPI003D7F376C